MSTAQGALRPLTPDAASRGIVDIPQTEGDELPDLNASVPNCWTVTPSRGLPPQLCRMSLINQLRLGECPSRDRGSLLGGLILDDHRVRELLHRTLAARVEQGERPVDQLQRSREH